MTVREIALKTALTLGWLTGLSLYSVVCNASYTYRDLGFLAGGSGYTIGQALNNRGTIIGYGDSASGQRSFIWENGVMVDFQSLSGALAGDTVRGVNNLGALVGTNGGAFLWSNGQRTDLGYFPLPLVSSAATSINDSGQVAGWGYAGPGSYRGWLWQDGSFVDIGTLGGPQSETTDINSGGSIVGRSNTDPRTQHAFIWHAGLMTNIGRLVPNATDSFALAINDSSAVVGGVSVGGAPRVAVMWSRGGATILPAFAGASSDYYATDINNRGVVTGLASTSTGSQRAVLWLNGEIQDLNEMVDTLEDGVTLKLAVSVNDSGQILVLGDNMHSYLLSPTITIPEPSAHFLFSAGLGFLLLVSGRSCKGPPPT